MAYYLVHAEPRMGLLAELAGKLAEEAFVDLEPFGRALSRSLCHARWDSRGMVVWEEEDYCDPPLRQEREAVLDHYFKSLRVESVAEGEGWGRIAELPRLFPDIC